MRVFSPRGFCEAWARYALGCCCHKVFFPMGLDVVFNLQVKIEGIACFMLSTKGGFTIILDGSELVVCLGRSTSGVGPSK